MSDIIDLQIDIEERREIKERSTFKVDDKKCGLHLGLEHLFKSYLAQLQ